MPLSDVKSKLGRVGVWAVTEGMAAAQAVEFAQKLESLGYGSMWLPETVGRDPFAHAALLGTGTQRMVLATGIANIYNRHAGVMKQAANTLAEQTGGRFILGIGVSHGPMVAGLRKLDYSKPLSRMREYLETYESSPYMAWPPAEPAPRLLAALGPKMLELAGTAADGAHPYWTTPEHTAQAREILGPDKLLCVEQKIVLSTDATVARATANNALGMYANLPNYRNNWLRLGFTEDEIESRDDRFIDAVVAWGDADAARSRIQAHLDAGADHVCIQPLDPAGGYGPDHAALKELSPSA